MALKITKHGKRLIILGVVCYVIFLFVTLPASFLTGYILPSIKSAQLIKLQSVHGNIWNGHATHARVDSFNLGKLDWRLSPWGLLAGDVDLNLKGVGLKDTPYKNLPLALFEVNASFKEGWFKAAVSIEGLAEKPNVREGKASVEQRLEQIESTLEGRQENVAEARIVILAGVDQDVLNMLVEAGQHP